MTNTAPVPSDLLSFHSLEMQGCGGYIYSGEGQELGQFWAKLNVGNAKLQKTSSNTSITDSNGNYSVAGAIYGVFSDKDCTKQLATLRLMKTEYRCCRGKSRHSLYQGIIRTSRI